jgi:RimJ/RimL family protein N-acetyltransferase
VADAAEVNRSVRESFNELHAWMVWAKTEPTPEQTEMFLRQAVADFVLRRAFHFNMYLREGNSFAGGISLFNINWSIPSFEIGYWLRTPLCGKGYMTEAVVALAKMAMEELKANRVEIRCDVNNLRSRKVAEMAGFRLEGVLKNDARTPAGDLRSTCVYSKA